MIGTLLSLTLPQLTDTMADVVSKTATCLSQINVSLGDKATQAGLNLNSDISFLGNRATNVGGVVMVDGNNPTAAGSIYYHSGEFYAIDGTGTIKLTNLGALNAAGIGGIGGDYGGVNPALESYDNATGQYRFYTNGGTHAWADIAAHGLILEGTAGTTELTCDSSVTVNQTLPIGRINSTDLLAWDGTKIIPAGATNTYGTGLKLGGPISVSDIHISTNKQVRIPLSWGVTSGAGLTLGQYNLTSTGAGWNWLGALPVGTGDVINFISATFQTVGAGTKKVELYSNSNGSSGAGTLVQSFTSSSGTSPLTIVGSLTSPPTVADGTYYYVLVTGPGGDVFTSATYSTTR